MDEIGLWQALAALVVAGLGVMLHGRWARRRTERKQREEAAKRESVEEALHSLAEREEESRIERAGARRMAEEIARLKAQREAEQAQRDADLAQAQAPAAAGEDGPAPAPTATEARDTELREAARREAEAHAEAQRAAQAEARARAEQALREAQEAAHRAEQDNLRNEFERLMAAQRGEASPAVQAESDSLPPLEWAITGSPAKSLDAGATPDEPDTLAEPVEPGLMATAEDLEAEALKAERVEAERLEAERLEEQRLEEKRLLAEREAAAREVTAREAAAREAQARETEAREAAAREAAQRHANVVAGEAGGITQAIGAYQVATEIGGVERRITFIDTPGHEAFTAMRARGAKSTDIAILVVAADDGVMPQTIEALNHAKAADVPVVVAVNKIDKETADPVKVRGELTEYGLIPEEYGGDTMFVDVSAVTHAGLDELLEAVVLTADAALDLRANPDMPAQGVAIEAHLDKGRGPVATVLVHRGTLRTGDSIVAGSAHGRVRAMITDSGETVDEAPPSMPVQVLGLTSVPGAGDNFLVVDDDRMARQIADKREARQRAALLAKTTRRKTLDQLFEQLEKGETQELKLILKGDSAGSVEALEDSLAKIEVDDEVSLRVIDRGVGAITETNVSLAAASDAVIIGYNVRAQGKATQMADAEGVDIRYYSVIYAAIDEVEAALKGMLKPIYEEKTMGQAEIREIFKSSKFGTIAGCMVLEGHIKRNAKARLLRDGVVITETSIASLRREKDDVTDVREGYECGLTLHNYNDIKHGDIVETYEMVEKPRD